LAAFINALKVVNKKIGEVRVVLIGAGAANINIARILIFYGLKPGNMIVIDSKGIIDRTNRSADRAVYRQKWDLAQITNQDQVSGDLVNAFKGADAVIALSASKPGTVTKDQVRAMAKKAIVFTCANPLPEIWPEDAKAAGAAVVATGRSDFPNQANNSLGFPGIFRGVLDVRSSKITDTMCVRVAESIAEYAEKKGLTAERIVPSMDDFDLFEFEALAAARQAIKEGLNRLTLTDDELRAKIRKNLARS
jgi:malate dehydrogenase (oxaloacetate-decarboxylating)